MPNIFHSVKLLLFIYPLFIVLTFWIVWMMLLWTFVYRFLYGHVLFLLGIYLGVEVLIICLTAELFSKVAKSFYNPPRNVWGIQLLHIFGSTGYCSSFDFSYFCECEIVSHGFFPFAFFRWLIMLSINMFIIYLCVFFWWKAYSDPLPMLKIELSSHCWVIRVIYLFCIQSLIRYMICIFFHWMDCLSLS